MEWYIHHERNSHTPSRHRRLFPLATSTNTLVHHEENTRKGSIDSACVYFRGRWARGVTVLFSSSMSFSSSSSKICETLSEPPRTALEACSALFLCTRVYTRHTFASLI